MKPRRLNRRGEAAKVEKRRGSSTVTTKWVKEQKTEQELHPFVPTIPLRYRKDHVMFHFDDEARIGVSRREQEEEEKRQREKMAEEERDRQRKEKEKEEREHNKKKEELRCWIQKEEEEKQKALGRAVLEWHKEVQRWGRARQEKGQLLEGLRRSSDLENDEPNNEMEEKPCTCLPAGQGASVFEEKEESFVDSLELVEGEPKETPSPLLHSPAHLLAHYAKEAAREQPDLFRESRMEHAPSSGSGQPTHLKETEKRRGSHSGLFENLDQREGKEKSRKTSYPGRALRSSILAWREGVERVSRAASSRSQMPTSSYGQGGKARSERARSHDHVNFSKITTSITSPWVLRPGSLMVGPKTWPPGGRGSVSTNHWRDLGERDTLFRSLSDPELAKVFDASSSSQGSTSAAASFNWSLRPKGLGARGKGPETRWRPALDERYMKPQQTINQRTTKREDIHHMELVKPQQEFTRMRGAPSKKSEKPPVRVDLEEREREEAVYDYLPHTLELSARLRHI